MRQENPLSSVLVLKSPCASPRPAMTSVLGPGPAAPSAPCREAPLSPTPVPPQVCSVLESLEQEYKREEDWCGGADKLGPNSETDHVTPMISKHLEQKEAFLKVRSRPSGCWSLAHGVCRPRRVHLSLGSAWKPSSPHACSVGSDGVTLLPWWLIR